MSWLILIIISAILAAFHQIYAKKALLKEHATEFLTILSIFSALISLLFIPKLSFNFHYMFYFIMFIAAMLNSISGLLYVKSLKHMEISSVAPLQNLSPLFLLVIGFFFLGERLSMLQISGILLLVFGAYFLESTLHSKKALEPFKDMFKSKFMKYIMVSLVILAIVAALDKYVLSQGINSYTLIAFKYPFVAMFFLSITFTKYNGFKDIYHGIKTSGVVIAFCALIGVASLYFYFEAVSLAYVSLVIPIKRMSTLISTMAGGEIFHEHNLAHKAIGCVIMVIGAVFIAI